MSQIYHASILSILRQAIHLRTSAAILRYLFNFFSPKFLQSFSSYAYQVYIVTGVFVVLVYNLYSVHRPRVKLEYVYLTAVYCCEFRCILRGNFTDTRFAHVLHTSMRHLCAWPIFTCLISTFFFYPQLINDPIGSGNKHNQKLFIINEMYTYCFIAYIYIYYIYIS